MDGFIICTQVYKALVLWQRLLT